MSCFASLLINTYLFNIKALSEVMQPRMHQYEATVIRDNTETERYRRANQSEDEREQRDLEVAEIMLAPCQRGISWNATEQVRDSQITSIKSTAKYFL